jgi:hypothetical protein
MNENKDNDQDDYPEKFMWGAFALCFVAIVLIVLNEVL